MNNYSIVCTGEVSSDYASPTLSIIYNRPDTYKIITDIFQNVVKAAYTPISIVDCSYYEYKIIKNNGNYKKVEEAYLLHCVAKGRGAVTIPVVNVNGMHYVPKNSFTLNMLKNGKRIFDYAMDSMIGYIYREYIKKDIIEFIHYIDEIDNV